MGFRSTSCKLFTALFWLMASAPVAQAAEGDLSPFNLNGRYEITWSGIPIGRINLISKEDTANYSLNIDVKTKGIAAMFSDTKEELSANGKSTASGTYIPAYYQSIPQKKDKKDDIKLTFDAAGQLIKREIDNEDDPAWRPPVPEEEINTATDPITAAFILRKKLHATMRGKFADLKTRFYDGERLGQMLLVNIANTELDVLGAPMQVVKVTLKRAPITGYTPKEIKKYKKGDPEINFYFSDDEAFIPVRATAKAALGELTMTLVEKN